MVRILALPQAERGRQRASSWKSSQNGQGVPAVGSRGFRGGRNLGGWNRSIYRSQGCKSEGNFVRKGMVDGCDAVHALLGWQYVCSWAGGFLLPVFSPDPSGVVIIVCVMPPGGLQAWWTDSKLYSIAWTTVCLLLGGGFSLAVSSPDSGLGKIIMSALAFGGFACAAMLWSRGISKFLSKIGITNVAMQAMVSVCLIICAIHALNFVGSLAAKSSTHKAQLKISVSGTSAPFRKAAEQGDADAQYNLGVLYYEEWEGKASSRTIRKRRFGVARSGHGGHGSTLLIHITGATLNRCYGFARRPSRATPTRKTPSGTCTTTATARLVCSLLCMGTISGCALVSQGG